MSGVESAVLDSVKYLRGVRPIDPAELVEYVSEPVDTDTIRSIVRAHALDLELIEREDGMFEPAPTEPLSHAPVAIDRLPERYCAFVHSSLEEHLGRDWARGRSGEQLRRRVRQLKRRYLEGGSLTYDAMDALAYLVYHSPRTYTAMRYTLAELTARSLLVPPLRILDVGAGTGGQLAAVADAVGTETLVSYDAVEPSPLGALCESVTTDYVGCNVHVSLHREPIEAVEFDGQYDVILLGNVLSELRDPHEIAAETFELVGQTGSWVALAPADPRTSTQLFSIERSLVPPATAYAPMLRLWSGREPHDKAWSFVEHSPIEPPSFQRALQAPAPEGERDQYATRSIRYAYTILRRDDTRRYTVRGDPDRYRPLGDIEAAIGNRVDCISVKLSADLSEGDGNPLIRLGDGSQQVDCFGVCVRQTMLNEALIEAPYGAIVSIQQCLVLWNDDEAAINLVIDDETVVDQLAP